MDERAFTGMVRRERPLLVAHARRIVGSARAEDVVQIALLQAWMFDAPIEHERAFLMRVVRNVAINTLKGAASLERALPDDVVDDRDPAEIVQRRDELYRAMQTIADLDRPLAALFLRSLDDAGRAGSGRPGRERQAIFRVRARLRSDR